MVVCYGSAARPINQAASWLLEVLHAKEPEVGHNANVNQEARLGQTTPFPFLWLPSQTAPTPFHVVRDWRSRGLGLGVYPSA